MKWTQKETTLLKELKSQEQLCIEKYGRYAEQAHDPELKQLFGRIRSHEEQHLNTIEGMLQDRIPAGYSPQTFEPPMASVTVNQAVQTQEKQEDAFLCQDALSMEKHVSGVYDTSIFEFCSPAVRQTLNTIQGQEQWHGEQIFAYMARNGMYQVN